jgi:hypothetical protein
MGGDVKASRVGESGLRLKRFLERGTFVAG